MKKIEALLKNFLLRILLEISKFSKTEKRDSSKKFSKILFIRLNRIGDALTTTPLLHLIKKKINCKIFVLADRNNYFVYTNNPDVDKVITFQKGIKGTIDILTLIKNEGIDTVVDLHDDVSTTVSYIVALSRAANKFGLEKENKIIYTKTVPKLDHVSTHVVNRILELGKLFNIKVENTKNKIGYYPLYESQTKADAFLKKSFTDKKFLIGINISAGSEARFWGVERFKLLIQFLLNYNSKSGTSILNILVLSAVKDLHYANEIIQGKNENQISAQAALFSSENFDEFAAVISNLNLLFTPDTAAVHLAAAFGVPVFGIYVHDTTEMIWSPYESEFQCVTTKDSNLIKMSFEEVKNRFQPFLEEKLFKVSVK